MNRKLRVGIIGLGVGEKHLAAYKAYPGCEVAAICDFNEEKLSAHKDTVASVLVTPDADRVLDDPSIQVVSIASYDNYHAAQVTKALQQGKHVFVEKPLCLSRKEAQEITSSLQSHPELKLSSNLNLRTVPRFQWLREKLADGTLGIPYSIEADYLWGRLTKLTQEWRGQMPYYSIILGAGVHMIDLILWLRPHDVLKEVFALGNQIATKNSGFRFNDFALITLQFESGLIAKVTGNAGSVMPHFHRLNVYGTKGTFLQEPKGAWWYRSADGEPEPVTAAYPAREEKGNMITSFLDSILDAKKTPLVTARDVLASMEVCLAADESMKTGKPVIFKQEELVS